jgi:hypothetical protein
MPVKDWNSTGEDLRTNDTLEARFCYKQKDNKTIKDAKWQVKVYDGIGCACWKDVVDCECECDCDLEYAEMTEYNPSSQSGPILYTAPFVVNGQDPGANGGEKIAIIPTKMNKFSWSINECSNAKNDKMTILLGNQTVMPIISPATDAGVNPLVAWPGTLPVNYPGAVGFGDSTIYDVQNYMYVTIKISTKLPGDELIQFYPDTSAIVVTNGSNVYSNLVQSAGDALICWKHYLGPVCEDKLVSINPKSTPVGPEGGWEFTNPDYTPTPFNNYLVYSSPVDFVLTSSANITFTFPLPNGTNLVLSGELIKNENPSGVYNLVFTGFWLPVTVNKNQLRCDLEYQTNNIALKFLPTCLNCNFDFKIKIFNNATPKIDVEFVYNPGANIFVCNKPVTIKYKLSDNDDTEFYVSYNNMLQFGTIKWYQSTISENPPPNPPPSSDWALLSPQPDSTHPLVSTSTNGGCFALVYTPKVPLMPGMDYLEVKFIDSCGAFVNSNCYLFMIHA